MNNKVEIKKNKGNYKAILDTVSSLRPKLFFDSLFIYRVCKVEKREIPLGLLIPSLIIKNRYNLETFSIKVSLHGSPKITTAEK